jgi:hypothetical protein
MIQGERLLKQCKRPREPTKGREHLRGGVDEVHVESDVAVEGGPTEKDRLSHQYVRHSEYHRLHRLAEGG